MPPPLAGRVAYMAQSDLLAPWLDVTGNVVSWNPGAQRIKGYAASEIIGRHFSTFYPPDDLANNKPAHELEVLLMVSKDLGLLAEAEWKDFDERVSRVAAMLSGLIKMPPRETR